ncbi:MAG TPA: NAD(P)-binding domain-containing protein [Thermoplasmata archaeon]|nr:NAD(P)-binding domain-containing protein [Thermoplasmata archaeon]
MKVGILGSGDVAKALGTGFVTLGHEVMLGSRTAGNAKAKAWAKETHGKGSTGTFAEAAAFGEVVVLATLGVATPEAIRMAGPSHFDGKLVIDATNPLAFSAQGLPSLAIGHTTSAGEVHQKELPNAHVVKAFNTVGNVLFFRPSLPQGPPTMFICGNDAAAKKKVEGFLHDFGWPSVIDVGGIESSRELEAMCILWVKAAIGLGDFKIAFKVLRS